MILVRHGVDTAPGNFKAERTLGQGSPKYSNGN